MTSSTGKQRSSGPARHKPNWRSEESWSVFVSTGVVQPSFATQSIVVRDPDGHAIRSRSHS